MKISLFIATCVAGAGLAAGASAQGTTHPTKSPAAGPRHKLPKPAIQVAPTGAQIATGANDDCTNPKTISGSGPFAFDTTVASTGAQGQSEGICLFFGTTGISNDTWYTWTAGFSGAARLSLCGMASHDTKVAVYDGAGCPGAGAIACNDDSCGLITELTFSCNAGSQYTVQLGNYPSAAGGSGTFTINQVITPSNDDCSNPIAISGAGPHAYDTSSATTGSQGQTNGNCLYFGQTGIANDVWFTWNAGFSGPAEIVFCNTSFFDTKAAVYDGAGCPVASAIGCDDDACFFAGPSRVTFTAVAGNDYTIQAGCYPFPPVGGAGTFSIIPFVPAAGDLCTAPIPISGPGPHAFDTTNATQGTEGQNNPNCLFFGTTQIDKDVWYVWTSNCTGTVTLSLCAGASHDTKIAAYDGTACPQNTALACDDDLCFFAGPSEVQFNAVSGLTYVLQIGNYIGDSGTGTFTLSCGGGGEPGTAFCVADGLGGTIGCPCGNNSTSGGGCNNSAGTGGAVLSGAGSAGAGTVVLTSSGELPTALSIFLQGTTDLTPGVTFGDGVRCVGGNLKRLYVKNAVGGTVSAPDIPGGDPTIPTQSANLGDPIAPGSTRYYQVYYRDPNLGFCPSPPGNSWNVSSGYQILWP